MLITMTSNFMTSPIYLFYYFRITFSNPSEYEERAFCVKTFQNIKNSHGIIIYSAAITIPIINLYNIRKSRNHEIVFHIYCQDIQIVPHIMVITSTYGNDFMK